MGTKRRWRKVSQGYLHRFVLEPLTSVDCSVNAIIFA